MPPSMQRRPRGAVDLLDVVHVAQVEGDRRLEAGAVDRDSTPPTTLLPPPNGVTIASDAARPVDDRRDLGFVAREGDDVRRIGVVAEEAAHGVGERLAVGVRGALVEPGRADRGERRRRGDPRRASGRSRRAAAAPPRRSRSTRKSCGSGRARKPPPRRSGPRPRDPSRNASAVHPALFPLPVSSIVGASLRPIFISRPPRIDTTAV